MGSKYEKRVAALEQQGQVKALHVVRWTRGDDFEEALARTLEPGGATERLLIERTIVDADDEGNVIPLVADNDPEVLKAHAWGNSGS